MAKTAYYTSGDKYNKLALTGKALYIKDRLHVECICDCGKVLFKRFDKLKAGLSKFCGDVNCRVSDVIYKGERFGILCATGKNKRDGNYTLAEMECECGDISYKRVTHLKDGCMSSCGKAGCKQKSFDDIYNSLKGQKYSDFTLTGMSKVIKGVRLAEARCICGRLKYHGLSKLKSGEVLSCGCKRLAYLSEASTIHGLNGHPTYNSYQNMVSRCTDTEDPVYHRYGGRGISICEEWLNDITAFHNWSMNNGWAKGLQIDRIDNDGNYEPSNCRWTTSEIQNRNKSNNFNINAFGETKCVAAWSKDSRCSVSRKTISYRIKNGVKPEMAITGKRQK